MQDKFTLPKTDFQAEGRCCIQYTDPLTDRVLEEIKGKNHVFSDQFVGLTNLLSPLNADLLLCAGGTAIDHDAPVIPGYPIGYGRVNNDGMGLFRGAYRVADSYIYRVSKTKINNKYVYDFLPTQALGPLKWVGLTGAVRHNYTTSPGIGTAAWKFPVQGTCERSNPKLYDCATGRYYRIDWLNDYSDNTRSHLTLYYMDTFYHAKEQTVDLLQVLGIAGFKYNTSTAVKLFLDGTTQKLYLYLQYTPRGADADTGPSYKVFQISADLSTLEAQWAVSPLPTTGFRYGGHYGGKLYYCDEDATDNYSGYYLNVVDLAAGTFTQTRQEIDVEPICNCFRFDSHRNSTPNPDAFLFKNYLWHGPYHGYGNINNTYGNDYFLYVDPMLDLSADGVMVSALPPIWAQGSSSGDSYVKQYRVGPAPMGLYGKQWGVYHYTPDSNGFVTPTLPFAYTCYQLPAGAPARPEGSGMTVTYELDITW